MQRVLVGIITCNRWDWFNRALESVKENTLVPFNLVIVDNSTDPDTAKRISRLSEFVISHDYNAGWVKAANRILRIAYACGSRWAAVLSDDLVVLKGWLREILDAFDERTAIVVPASANVCGFPATKEGYIEQSALPAFVARVGALAEVGWLDEGMFMYGADTEICLRLNEAGWRVKQIETDRIIHQFHDTRDIIDEELRKKLGDADIAKLCMRWGSREWFWWEDKVARARALGLEVGDENSVSLR